MAKAAEVKLQINDITECPICTEVYSDPRVLQCGHTFCFKCLKRWHADKNPGERMSCPMCRKEIEISSDGLDDLPKNFFVVRLLEVNISTRYKSEEIDSWCEMCKAVKNKNESATKYCTYCEQYFCSICSTFHQNQKFAKTHKIIAIEGDLLHTDLKNLSVSFCNQHKDEVLKLYCFDCKTTICVMCFIEGHKSHNCSNVDIVAQELSERLEGDIEDVSTQILEIEKKEIELDQEQQKFMVQIISNEAMIIKKAEEIKSLIVTHTSSLLQELDCKKNFKKIKEHEITKQEFEREKLILESFKKYCEEVKDKGTSCDIVHVADDLHTRAMEFKESNITKSNCSSSEVIFTGIDLEDLLTNDRSNLLGNISGEQVKCLKVWSSLKNESCVTVS